MLEHPMIKFRIIQLGTSLELHLLVLPMEQDTKSNNHQAKHDTTRNRDATGYHDEHAAIRMT